AVAQPRAGGNGESETPKVARRPSGLAHPDLHAQLRDARPQEGEPRLPGPRGPLQLGLSPSTARHTARPPTAGSRPRADRRLHVAHTSSRAYIVRNGGPSHAPASPPPLEGQRSPTLRALERRSRRHGLLPRRARPRGLRRSL